MNKEVPSQTFQAEQEVTSVSQENGIPLILFPEKIRWEEKGNKNRRIKLYEAVLPHNKHVAFKDTSGQAQRHIWNKETDGRSLN